MLKNILKWGGIILSSILFYTAFVISFIGICYLALSNIFNYNFIFHLIGDKAYTINLGESFNEPGFKCNIFKYDISNKVIINNKLDINNVGEYEINYYTKILGKSYDLKRKIKVIDNIAPDIKLNGDDKISLNVGTKYSELGASATDNYDGDLTNKISISNNIDINKPNVYTVIYTVKDSSGNESSVTREIEVKKVVNSPINNNYYSTNNSILNKEFVTSDDIINYVKNNNYKVSIGYYNLVNGNTFYYNKDTVYYGASLIKTLDAIYLYENGMVNNETKEHIKKNYIS